MTSAAPKPRLSVIGTGYLGATHAICMASAGFDVIALDVDQAKVDRLRAGEVPFHEPGLPELFAQVRANADGTAGTLTFTTDWAELAAHADVHFICVGTPQRKDGPGADLRYVDAAVTSLAPHLSGEHVVIGKSTVPVGTAARLADQLGAEAPGTATLVWNPEFLREGFAVEDTLRPDRVVFGVADGVTVPPSVSAAYAPILDRGTPLVVTDYATAELVKTSANAFLATKISFINAISEICETVGADVTHLAEAIGHDARIGKLFLRAGVGFGGGCLPKDIRAFHARAGELGHSESLAFLTEVDRINLRRRDRVLKLLTDELGGSLHGRKVTIWGAAFKPDSDDIRDSPALEIAMAVAGHGAQVTVYDPEAMDNARRVAPQLQYAGSLTESVDGADAIALLTEWREFRDADPATIAAGMPGRIVVDGRNVLDGPAWVAAGYSYLPLGRRTLRP